MIELQKILSDQVEIIAALAHQIWPVVYRDMMSEQQLNCMLEKIYSVEALVESIENGQEFYLLINENQPSGFVALQEFPAKLRLEKLYLLPEKQGFGLGKMAIEKIEHEARIRDKYILELNVNRKNPAYHFYLAQGFSVVKAVDIPFNGFILDDYIMQKKLL